MYWLTKIYPFSKLGQNAFFHGERTDKVLALTFDDGPTEGTLEVRDILKKYGVPATFFVIGNKVSEHSAVIRTMKSQGYEIGNHSYNHFPLAFRSQAVIRKEITSTDRELNNLGIETALFRPPHGSFGLNLLKVARSLDKKVIFWDVDPSDWKSAPGNVVDYLTTNVRPGSIVDLHDYAEGVGPTPNLPSILDQAIPKLMKKGYKFSTVSQLLHL